MNTGTQKDKNRVQGAGLFLAGTNILLLTAISWHAVVHPAVGATNEFTMQLIQRQPTVWFVLHMYFALAAALFAAAGLVILGAGTRLTATASGLVGWSTLTVINGLLSILTVIEATAQGNAAVAGDVNAFALWFSISRGFEILFILFPAAFFAITLCELRAPAPFMPRWASGLALLGAILMIVAVIGASGLRIVVLGPLWGATALPMIWFIWLGLRLAF
jgi:hypothetical protein